MGHTVLENEHLAIAVDAAGRIVSLKNKATVTELIGFPDASGAWRMVIPSGRHTVDFVDGSVQPLASTRRIEDDTGQTVLLVYDRLATPRGDILPIAARFSLHLGKDARELEACVELDNHSLRTVEEVEFPIIGGLGGFPSRCGRPVANLLAACDWGKFYGDVLNGPLPVTGRESNDFVREHETAMFEQHRGNIWVDLWGDQEGLFLMHRDRQFADFAVKIERFPKASPHGPDHVYPPGTPHWLRLFGLHVPRLAPGGRWTSESVVVMPHRGGWHTGADRYAASRHRDLKVAEPPSWTRQFTGWTAILGKTYLGEVFHDFRTCAQSAVADKKVTGIDLIYYYGHTELGAEGADLDQSPAAGLGGDGEFRKMVDTLHECHCRIMLLDHLHRWVNRDIPEYRSLNLERHAVRDEQGHLVTARWWKETFLSCRRLEGPTPTWVEMCPASDEWLRIYLRHVERMIAMGVDGLELDTFNASSCHNPDHAHPPGEIQDLKLRFVRTIRQRAKQLNPDFLIIGETMRPEALEVLDGFYPSPRYDDGENGNIYRYLFPQARLQVVKVGNYDYAAVNRALGLALGIDTEIWGLRRTALAACPELAEYIGEVNRFRRAYAAVMLNGRFLDTLGADVQGNVCYSVLQSANEGKALVLRNPTNEPVSVTASLDGVEGKELRLWQPHRGEAPVTSLPLAMTLGPFAAVVLLAGALETPK